ncbi:transporter [Specibacter sp. RAF43]|uniref:transporter n=1 Tax=Specibacter sp. RAF43 TaxID=3233057 RepID=UPI003F9DC2D1
MVAHLLSLKLTLLRNSLRRSPMQLVGLIIGALYGLGLLVLVLAGFVLLGANGSREWIGTVVTLAGAALILGWLVIPVIASGVDMTLDPARFVTYSIPGKTLLLGLALSSFIGIPGVLTLVASVGTALAWWRHPAAGAAALLCGIVAALTCIVASRAITTASTSLASSRKFKDLSGVVVLVPLVFLGPIVGSVSDGVRDLREYLPALAGTVSWTPLGAVWAVPADVAAGAYGAGALKLLIALATLAALTWLWQATLAKALVTPAFAGSARRKGGQLGFFRYFPATPTGAVAARCLTYWFRDPRYTAGLVIAPLIPLVIVFAGTQAVGMDAMGAVLGYGAALAVFLVVWSISADISYDNTAFALHLATVLPGRADRTGRALAAGVLAVPLGLVYAVAGAAVGNDWAALPGTVGLVLGMAGSGLGLASVFSARFTLNVPLPGESPLKGKPGNNLAATLTQMAGFGGLAVLVVPELVLVIIGATTGRPLYGWLALAVGVVLGGVFLVTGIRIGARVYERRAPELLQAVSADR